MQMNLLGAHQERIFLTKNMKKYGGNLNDQI